MRYLLLVVLLGLPAYAANEATREERERLERVAAEVQRRRILREEAEAKARRLVREHESGVTKAPAAELAAARALIQQADDYRANVTPRLNPDPNAKPTDVVDLHMPAADMQTFATAWRHLFGGTVTINDRAKSRAATVIVRRVTREEVKARIVAALREAGVYVIQQPGGVLFDTEPERKQDQ